VYWSRSRKKLWHKGEESGHIQKVKEIRLDCDGDAILLQIEQQAVLRVIPDVKLFFQPPGRWQWVEADAVLKSPDEIYRNKIENMSQDILQRLTETWSAQKCVA